MPGVRPLPLGHSMPARWGVHSCQEQPVRTAAEPCRTLRWGKTRLEAELLTLKVAVDAQVKVGLLALTLWA